ncbi:SatD family protein [Clostridium paraputrificum]|uniref:SatD family protein n=1 Tax=Clostridium paraputrificum TaxID=29363 RepID=UPI0034A54003
MYKVLIFDIKDSRKISNREDLQKTLITLIKECNRIFKEYILSPFCITCGDEWEGLLTINSPHLEIHRFFKNGLPSNINFYFGIGIGEISIKDFSLPTNCLDGEAFIKAREELNKAKSNNIFS